MILVTGATGRNGSEVVRQLDSRGVKVRAMVRDPQRATHIASLSNVELFVGDFDDPEQTQRAMSGVTSAFLVTNSTERAELQQLAFVESARKLGLSHIVKLSQFAADRNSPVRFLRYHAEVEDVIVGSGLEYTFLRPNLYMQGLLGFAEPIKNKGAFFAAVGDAAISIVDVRDIALVAAAALTDSKHKGKTYTITGPQALTHQDLAESLSDATGRTIKFVDVAPSAMRDTLQAMGMQPWQADGLAEDYAHYSRGEAATVSDHVEKVIGRPARSFAEFAQDYVKDFQ